MACGISIHFREKSMEHVGGEHEDVRLLHSGRVNHSVRNSSRASLTSSGCVQPMLCGPPSTVTSLRSAISPGSRSAVALYGRIRSSVPCTTSVGTSILGRSSRKSVSQVSTQAYVAYGEEPTATLNDACQAGLLIFVCPRTSTL